MMAPIYQCQKSFKKGRCLNYKAYIHVENVLCQKPANFLKISKFSNESKKSVMTFPFFLVILGQTDKPPPPKYSRRVKKFHVHPKYSRKPIRFSAKKPQKEQMPRFDFALIEAIKPMYI